MAERVLLAFLLLAMAVAGASCASGSEPIERRKLPDRADLEPSDQAQTQPESVEPSIQDALKRIRDHQFHPIRNGFTFDAQLQEQGVASLNNDDWRVRLLAIRDLMSLGPPAVDGLITHLEDPSEHVRQVCAMVLGQLRARTSVTAILRVLSSDGDMVVRSTAAISLGEIGDRASLAVLKDRSKTDPSRDVRHQCEIAAYRIENRAPSTTDDSELFAALDSSQFKQLTVGQPAIDFELNDTDGEIWRLSDHRGKAVVLIWIFADWCPVCHGEFHELIELRNEFRSRSIEVVTIECHDHFRARLMVGKELQPKYWFATKTPQESYRDAIWWRHLADPAGAVGVKYGVDPLAFVVHSEWVNRPTTIIVDSQGIVRLAYYGTYWGDRPTIANTLEMVINGRYEFTHPKRLVARDP